MHSKRDNIKIMIYDQAEKDDCKKIEKNNPEISVNALYVDKMNIYPTYISKHKSFFYRLQTEIDGITLQ